MHFLFRGFLYIFFVAYDRLVVDKTKTVVNMGKRVVKRKKKRHSSASSVASSTVDYSDINHTLEEDRHLDSFDKFTAMERR